MRQKKDSPKNNKDKTRTPQISKCFFYLFFLFQAPLFEPDRLKIRKEDMRKAKRINKEKGKL